MKISINISRQTRKFYEQATTISTAQFSLLWWKSKMHIFQIILHQYVLQSLWWFNSRSSSTKKMKSSYSSVLRRLLYTMYRCMPYSASELFVSCGILSFYELLRKCICYFSERIRRNTNFTIKTCLSPIVYILTINNFMLIIFYCYFLLSLYIS